MGRNNYFQFKQFRIIQEKAAMKVGTDGVLLGAWADVGAEYKILDIGTGTGVIALMMAQRTQAQITGVEIEKNAATEAAENVKNSPWANRISIQNISFQKFADSSAGKFDLIISNPPFFNNDRKPENDNLSIAKHNDFLSLPDILNGSIKLLNSLGKLAIVLPLAQAEIFIKLAKSQNLYLTRLTEVKPTPEKVPNRILMELGKMNTTLKKDQLTIFDKNGTCFSMPYKELTRDFYLNF